MPESISEIEHAFTVIRTEGLVMPIKIGDIRHQRVEAAFVLLGDIADGAWALQGAEITTEFLLLLICNVLVVKNQNAIFIHPGLDGRNLVGVERVFQIDALDFAAKHRMKWSNVNGHCQKNLSWFR